MRQYEYIIKHGFAAARISIVDFFRTMGMKLTWVLGSVAGLALFAASFTAVNRSSAYTEDMRVPSAATGTQQITIPSKTQPTANASSEGKTVITQSQQNSSTTSASPRASLRVNGVPVTLPSQGTVHKEVTDANGKTTIDVSVNSTSSGSTSSDSSSSITLQSTTESTNSTNMNNESEP